METHLKNKVAVVTGASRGIGRAIAERLSVEGMQLVVAARSGDQLHELVAGCTTAAHAFAVDLRLPSSPSRLIEFAIQKFGRIDLLVNNAGAAQRGDFLALSEEDWTDGFALKFFGSVRCIRAAWPFLVKSRGAIVNIIGIGGRTGSAEFAIGGSVNAALMNLTKALADRGVNDGVKVNAINPGTITTDRLRFRIRKLATERNISEDLAATEMAKKFGISRFGVPEEIASAVVFFASDLSSYCQGAILDVDGGQTRTL